MTDLNSMTIDQLRQALLFSGITIETYKKKTIEARAVKSSIEERIKALTPVEMTMADIEKQFGRKIILVGET